MPEPQTNRARRRAAQRRNPHCACQTAPTLVATFQDGYLVDIQWRHWSNRDGCTITEPINPEHYGASPLRPQWRTA